jgi:hypothetical protein
MVKMSYVFCTAGLSFVARRPPTLAYFSNRRIREKKKERLMSSSSAIYWIGRYIKAGGVHCLRGIVLPFFWTQCVSNNNETTRAARLIAIILNHAACSTYIHMCFFAGGETQSLAAKTLIKYSTLYLRE